MRLLSLSVFALAVAPLVVAGQPAGFKTLYEQKFATPESTKDFVFTDPAVWKYGKDADGGFLELAYDKEKYKNAYEPKNRSPFHIALLADRQFTDFVLDCELQSTIAPYGHQDMCLFFGFTDPQKFYYVHIARAADMNAHNVFIVNDAPRKNFAAETTKGVDWKEKTWHKVRITRDTATGKIEVFFDDLTKPVMKAEDKTFGTGWIGFGSFDDIGRVRNIKISGPKAELKKADFFKPLGK